MRLGQTSRALEIPSHKIVELVNENFREINDHPNVKLTDEEFEFVQNHFAPPGEEVPIEPAGETTPDTTIDSPIEDGKPEKEVPEFIEELRPKVITLEQDFNEKTEDLESYKAEKVTLDGLKVLGKIDLPEPKVKEPKEATEEDEKPRRRKFEKRPDRDRRNRRNGKKTLSPAEERAKAERVAYRKKIEEEKRQKELKKKHYEQNVKTKIQPPKPKKKKKLVEETVPAPTTPTNKAPKKDIHKATGLKRLWLWLNGAYDKHD